MLLILILLYFLISLNLTLFLFHPWDLLAIDAQCKVKFIKTSPHELSESMSIVEALLSLGKSSPGNWLSFETMDV